MLRVVFSDRVERLWEVLAERVRARVDPFERLVVAVPSRVVERRAELALARALGIVAAIDLTRLPAELEARVRSATGREVLSASLCEGLVRDVLLTPARLASDELAPVRAYVDGEGEGGGTRALRERRACELASRLARLYASYTLDRPELVRAWRAGERGPGARAWWQGALLREALGPLDDAVTTLAEGALALAAPDRRAESVPLVVLGYSYFSRVEHELVRAIATRGEVLVLTPAPCAEFWEDATRRSADDTGSESPLLASWGTAAREHVAALDAATEYAAERFFADADERTRLGRLQASIRQRRPIRAAEASAARDGSVVVVAAPSLRREVEAVAGEIWARVHQAATTGAPLRFPDVAVWIPARDRDLYLPQIETVFAEARDIPWSGVDLALASRSRVLEVIVRLVRLVAAGPTRAGLLDVLLHPLVLARLPGAGEAGAPEPEALALAIERLGVYFGTGPEELPATYAADPCAIHLEQAIERLALGAVMLGERSGDERFFEQDGQRWLPEELDLDGGVDGVVSLIRSLAADVAAARRASLPVDAWARFFVSLAETYVVTEGMEQAEHRRALLALRDLGGPSLDGGARLGCAAASSLALRALESLPAARGASDRGVLVGALAPHRAGDHRLVFVLGLGESRFPSHEPETGLDLRAETGRQACEVTAEDRDRLALLEALVSARDALVLSWVARDEQTGDDIAPAHALSELHAQLPELERSRPPLRRDVALLAAAREGDLAARVATLAFPIAEAEARARVLGDAERARWASSALPLADLLRELAPDDPRRAGLLLPPIPPRPAAEAGAVVRVTLDDLRRFLDCPVQAAARRIVGRADDDDDASGDSEPFDLDRWTHADVVRALVLGALGATTSVEALAAHGVAHGTFPLGAFGERARSLASDEAEQMLAELRRARPGVREAAAVRFGAGREHGDAAGRALDPIALGPLPDGRALELVGTTAPLLGGEEPLQLDFGAERARERKQIADLRLALRAFVDHAALCLEPRATARSRRALVVARHGSTSVTLKPLRPDLARRWLAGLARELATEPQTSFMPIESVLRVAHLFVSGSPTLERDLSRSIDVVRGPKWEGGRSRYGPVRGAVRLPAPSAPARLVGQRFALFFQHLHEPAIVPPSKGAAR